ncbi:MAG: hypothetical protein ABUS57_07380 [Pseudomonadota bacterium]
MRIARLILVCAALAACSQSAPTPAAAPTTAFTLAARAEGAALLSANDEYMAALSPADLSIWLKRPDGGDRAAFAAFLAAGAQEWSPEERTRLEAMLARDTPRLAGLSGWLPEHVLIAKIDPAASGDSDFTRANAIFLKAPLPDTEDKLDDLFFHELFHVLSRHNPERRDALYGVLGFVRCTPMDLPADLRARLLTNPDAPLAEHATPVGGTDASLYVTPLLVADPTRFTPAHPNFFDYLHVRFTTLRRDSAGRCTPVDTTMKPDALRDVVLAHAGRNTDYLFHPEETLADNFAQMMVGRRDAPNPEVYDRLAVVLGIPRPAPR